MSFKVNYGGSDEPPKSITIEKDIEIMPNTKTGKFWVKPDVIRIIEDIIGEDNVYQIVKKRGRSYDTPDLILNMFGRGFFVFIKVDNVRLTEEQKDFLATFEYSFVVFAEFGKSKEKMIEEIRSDIMACATKNKKVG